MPPWGELLSLTNLHSNVPLTSSRVVIGRSPDCSVVLTCDVISSKHCSLIWDGEKATLQDHSRNGTYVNDALVGRGKTVDLPNGATICVSKHAASAVIKFIFKAAPPPVVPDAASGIRAPTAAKAGNMASGGLSIRARGDAAGAGGGPTPIDSVISEGKLEDKYTIGEKLGSGAFAVVKKGTVKETGQVVAIKVIDKAKAQLMSHATSRDMLYEEVKILRRLNFRHIIRCYDVYDTPRYFYIILEFASGGELFDKIIEKKRFTEYQAKGLFQQILNGVAYLHREDVAHRDLKPENILLHRLSDDPSNRSHRYIVKISDFGMSRIAGPGHMMSTLAGTPQYLAPEVFESARGGTGYGKAADLWSLGVILYILLCSRQPFSDTPEFPLLDRIKQGCIDFAEDTWKLLSPEARHLVTGLLTVDPGARMTVEEVQAHPWVSMTAADMAASVKGAKKQKKTRTAERATASSKSAAKPAKGKGRQDARGSAATPKALASPLETVDCPDGEAHGNTGKEDGGESKGSAGAKGLAAKRGGAGAVTKTGHESASVGGEGGALAGVPSSGGAPAKVPTRRLKQAPSSSSAALPPSPPCNEDDSTSATTLKPSPSALSTGTASVGAQTASPSTSPQRRGSGREKRGRDAPVPTSSSPATIAKADGKPREVVADAAELPGRRASKRRRAP